MCSQSTQPALEQSSPRHVSFGEALRFWLKLGFISFGGPAGQIAVMHKELVERRRWISENRFLHALNYCMLLPGPEATQLAVYIGWLMHGMFGGIVAGLLFFLPGVLLLIALSWAYVTYGQLGAVAGILYGFKAAVVALVLSAIVRIGRRAVRTLVLGLFSAAAFALITFTSVPFPLLIFGAALAGWIGSRIWPDAFMPKAGNSHTSSKTPQSAAAENATSPIIIDDHTPPPDHARIRKSHLALIAFVFALLTVAPLAALAISRGYDDIYAKMGRFFTLAAYVTIGGAYAVLPYVQHMSTNVYAWLKPGQMMDGLALGETTPGPLILVLTFVGFVGAWNAQLGFGGALFGALLVTYFTFLPSFMFILLGAPFVEHTRGEIRLAGIMNAITAAVVGVIFNMAVFFGEHVLFPAGIYGGIDFASLAIIIAAFAAIQWRKWDVTLVILISGVIGVALKFAGAISG